MLTECNLLPWRQYAYQKKLVRIVKVSAVIMLVMVVIGILGYFFLLQNIAIYTHHQRSYQKKLRDMQPQLRAIKRWQVQLAQINEKNCWINKLQCVQQKIPYLLQQIAFLTPKAVCITTIYRNGQKVHLSGVSQTSKPLFAMVHHFEQLAWLRDVRLNQVNMKPILQSHRWLSSFTIEFTLREEKGEAVCK